MSDTRRIIGRWPDEAFVRAGLRPQICRQIHGAGNRAINVINPRCGGEMREDNESQIIPEDFNSNRHHGSGSTFSVNHGGM
jgi:hypothetical protein